METRSPVPDDVDIDLRREVDAEGERWLTVAEASELIGVSGDAIRGWYRSGRIASHRAEGDHGPHLVPLSAILRLGVDVDEPDDDGVLDLDAGTWSATTAEDALRRELDDVRRQVEFLREQLAESAAGERAAQARAEAAEAELARLQAIAAATSSITDPSWLELSPNRYEGPVRRQDPAALRAVTTVEADAGGSDDANVDVVDDEPEAPPRARPTADDLLPAAAERRRRRGRR